MKSEKKMNSDKLLEAFKAWEYYFVNDIVEVYLSVLVKQDKLLDYIRKTNTKLAEYIKMSKTKDLYDKILNYYGEDRYLNNMEALRIFCEILDQPENINLYEESKEFLKREASIEETEENEDIDDGFYNAGLVELVALINEL